MYRVVEPEYWQDDAGNPGSFRVLPDAFEDRQSKNRDTLSFFVDSYAKPRDALTAISKRRSVRDTCGTGREFPSPEEMYRAGYRVVKLTGAIILDAANSPDNQLSIKEEAE